MRYSIQIYGFMLMLMCNIGTAQSQVSREDYDQTINFCSCKIIIGYAEEYLKQNGAAKSKEKTAYDEKIKNILKDCDINTKIVSYANQKSLLRANEFRELEQRISAVFDKLSTGFNKSMSKAEVLNTLMEGVYESDSFQTLFDSYPAMKEERSAVEQELRAFLKLEEDQLQQTPKDEVPETNLILEEGEEGETLPENDSAGLFSFNVFSLLLILLLGAGLSFFIVRNRNDLKAILEKLEKQKEKVENLRAKDDSQNNIAALNRNKKQTDQQLKAFELQIEQLYERIKVLEEAGVPEKKEPDFFNQERDEAHQTESPTISMMPEVYYAQAPNGDGTFSINSLSKDIGPKAMYKITIETENNNLAIFEFCNSEYSVKRATNTPDLFIYPVCESNEVLNQNASSIITKKPGYIRKDDDLWVLIEKAEIIYG